jgi:hypothetical protein
MTSAGPIPKCSFAGVEECEGGMEERRASGGGGV